MGFFDESRTPITFFHSHHFLPSPLLLLYFPLSAFCLILRNRGKQTKVAGAFNGPRSHSLMFSAKIGFVFAFDFSQAGNKPSEKAYILPIYFFKVFFAKITIHNFLRGKIKMVFLLFLFLLGCLGNRV